MLDSWVRPGPGFSWCPSMTDRRFVLLSRMRLARILATLFGLAALASFVLTRARTPLWHLVIVALLLASLGAALTYFLFAATELKLEPANSRRRCMTTVTVCGAVGFGWLFWDITLLRQGLAMRWCRACTPSDFAYAQAPFWFWVSHAASLLLAGMLLWTAAQLIKKHGVFCRVAVDDAPNGLPGGSSGTEDQ